MARVNIREMDRYREARIGSSMSKRRYQVMYDDLVSIWAVVDTMAHGRKLSRHAGEKEARDAAWREEERWYKCSGEEEPAA